MSCFSVDRLEVSFFRMDLITHLRRIPGSTFEAIFSVFIISQTIFIFNGDSSTHRNFCLKLLFRNIDFSSNELILQLL